LRSGGLEPWGGDGVSDDGGEKGARRDAGRHGELGDSFASCKAAEYFVSAVINGTSGNGAGRGLWNTNRLGAGDGCLPQ